MIKFILKGVDFTDKRLTRKPSVWLEYLCWCISNQMSTHKPYLPDWLRMFICKRVAPSRFLATWNTIKGWQSIDPTFDVSKSKFRPLPWYIGVAAIGPFVPVWDRVTRIFRNRTGGRSHRCEFTDKTNGALYGGQEGGYMNRMFDRFIEDISL